MEHKDAFQPYENLNAVLRLFFLSYIYRDGIKLRASWSIYKITFTILFISVANAVNVYLKFSNFDIKETMKFTDFIQLAFLMRYFEYVIAVFFVSKYGREMCLGYFRVYDHIDSILHMAYYDVLKECIFNLLTYCAIAGVISTVLDFAAWCIATGWAITTLFAIDYCYYFLRMFSVVDYAAHISQVEFRMKMIENVLEEFYSSKLSIPEVMKAVITNTKLLQSNTKLNRLDSLKTISLNRNYSVVKLSRCYLLLLEQVDFINNLFGCRMLLTCLFFLIDTTMLLNLVMRLVFETLGPMQISKWYIVLSTFVRMISTGSISVCTVYRAEQNHKTSRRIIRLLDFSLINKDLIGAKVKHSCVDWQNPMQAFFFYNEIRDTFKELRDLMTTRPLEFHAVHFFKVNYPLLVSLASVIVTYSIILLQYMK